MCFGNSGSASGGYNPQIMPGQGGNNGGGPETGATGGLNNIDGAPFWSPWSGWNMKAGTYPTQAGNAAQGAAQAPGAPEWLTGMLGNYMNQPMYTNPNQYGRWNWGTNLQGGGQPSPFGQYAQQTAQYPGLQFPPMPQPGQQQQQGSPLGQGSLGGFGSPVASTMQGQSSALGRPDLQTGRIQDFGPDNPAYHRLTNAYGNQLGPAGMSASEQANSAQYGQDKDAALFRALGIQAPTRNYNKLFSAQAGPAPGAPITDPGGFGAIANQQGSPLGPGALGGGPQGVPPIMDLRHIIAGGAGAPRRVR